MPLERRTIVDRKEWLEWRKPNVNASDAPAIIGKHPYKTRMRVWAEMRGAEFDQRETKQLLRGRWMEPAVARAVADLRPQWKLTQGDCYFVDTERRLGATPDYFVDDPERGGFGVLQCKTANKLVYDRDWHGGEQCSEYALWQNFTEVMLSGVAWGAVAVLLVDGYDVDCRVFDVPRNELAWAELKDQIASFWADVDAGREPAPNYALDGETIRALTPRAVEGKAIDLSGNNAWPIKLARRARLRDEVADADAELEKIESELKHALGDAEAAVGIPGWKITYKGGPRAGYTVQPKDYVRVLKITERQDR